MKKDILKNIKKFDLFKDELLNYEKDSVTIPQNNILSIQNLCVVIEEVMILKNVNIQINERQLIGFLGPSGCGKTILFNVILGLIPVNLVTGKFIIGNYMLSYEQYVSYVKKMSFASIPQDPFANVCENLNLFEHFRLFNDYNEMVTDEFVYQKLDEVRLPNPNLTMRKFPGELSGGQLQRFLISLVISRTPKVILADEPTAALDICNEIHVFKLLTSLSRKYNFSIIFISHNPSMLANFCSFIYCLKAGRVTEEIDIKR